MKKVLVMASAVAAVALTSVPAQAASPTSQAKGHVRVLRPLQIESKQDLNFGTLVLAGTGAWSGTVAIAQDGTPDCDGNSGNVVCSGTQQEALYTVTGTNMQSVAVTVSPTIDLDNLTDGTSTLTMTVDAPATVALGASGNAGVDFGIGGSISVSDATADGVYEGTFDVTADYQ